MTQSLKEILQYSFYLLSEYLWVDLEGLDPAVGILSAFLQRVGHLSFSLCTNPEKEKKKTVCRVPRFNTLSPHPLIETLGRSFYITISRFSGLFIT